MGVDAVEYVFPITQNDYSIFRETGPPSRIISYDILVVVFDIITLARIYTYTWIPYRCYTSA